jgi:hypothetical protein
MEESTVSFLLILISNCLLVHLFRVRRHWVVSLFYFFLTSKCKFWDVLG